VLSGDGINSTNQKGETYLHFAAFNAEPQLVKWLIEKGADCNLQVALPIMYQSTFFLTLTHPLAQPALSDSSLKASLKAG
jgi:ankyrin repeat protein